MKNIIFFGTIHGGHTDNDELIALIDGENPDYIFVEIAQDHITKGEIKTYPPEMIAVYQWAKSEKLPIYGFDSKIYEVLPGKEERIDELVAQQNKVIAAKNWKNFNNKDSLDTLLTAEWFKIIDPKKSAEREREMYDNISKKINADSTTVIVTGAGHIPFFKKKFPHSKFPLIN